MKKLILIYFISLSFLGFSQSYRMAFDETYNATANGLSKGQGRTTADNVKSSYATNLFGTLSAAHDEVLESSINMFKATRDKKQYAHIDSIINKVEIGIYVGPNYTFPTFRAGKGIGIHLFTTIYFGIKLSKKISFNLGFGYSKQGYPLNEWNSTKENSSYKFTSLYLTSAFFYRFKRNINVGLGVQPSNILTSFYDGYWTNGTIFTKNTRYLPIYLEAKKKYIISRLLQGGMGIKFNYSLKPLRKLIIDKYGDRYSVYDRPVFIELLFSLSINK